MSRTARTLLPLLGVLAAAPALGAGGRVVDQNGRSVDLPQPIRRMATLTIPGASMAMSVDLGAEKVVAIHPASRSEINGGLLGKIYPAALEIRADAAGDGFAPNVEALLSAQPDVVFQWGDRGKGIVDPIVRAGLPVVTLRYGGSDLAADWLELFGKTISGRAERGAALAKQFRHIRAQVARASAAIPADKRPKVLYLYRAAGNAIQVAGSGTSMDSDIALAGGVNVAATLPGFVPVSVEQLLAWAPDLILLNNFEKGLTPARVFANATLAGVPAVKERRVYRYPQGGFRWDPPSQESPLAWRWLYALFHPDGMSGRSLRREIAGSYRTLYGYTPSEQDIDTVLRLSENGASRHYLDTFGRQKN